jgi:hypothetical protein
MVKETLHSEMTMLVGSINMRPIKRRSLISLISLIRYLCNKLAYSGAVLGLISQAPARAQGPAASIRATYLATYLVIQWTIISVTERRTTCLYP